MLGVPMAFASSHWDPGFPLRRQLATDELLVGEWRCAGTDPSPTPSLEESRHFEISIQRRGSHTRVTGPERALADPAHVVLQEAGDRYRLSYPAAQRELSTVILVAPGLVAETLRAHGTGPALRRRAVPMAATVALAHHELQRAIATTSPLAITEAALALVAAVLGAAADRREVDPSPSAAQRILVEEIQHQLARRFREPLTLEDIAASVGVSTFHASRTFRRLLGTPMHRHLMHLRLLAALELLDERRGNWSALALEVGFSSHSHFTTAFRAAFGRSPKALG